MTENTKTCKQSVELEIQNQTQSSTQSNFQQLQDDNNIKTKVLCMYCLMAVCLGCIEPLGAALYVELQTQLNVPEEAIAFIFTTRSIASVISAIISGKVVDYFIESHRYVAVMTILFIASIICLPFTQNIHMLHVEFAVIGYVYNGYFVVIFLYVLRLYSDTKREVAGHQLYKILVTYGIAKTIYPLCIQLSLQYTNKYIYPLYSMLIIFVILFVLLLIFHTPKHDKLRTIKAELQNTKQTSSDCQDVTAAAENILKTLNSDTGIRAYETTVILILSIVEFCYSAMQEYYITFVTVYCKNSGIGEQYGRYLISCYFAGQLLYRIVNALFEQCEKIAPKYQMLISLILASSLSFVFLFVYDNVIWMLVVWFCSGFFAAALQPEIQIWTELIKPVTGTVEILYCLTNSAGEVVAAVGFGLLLQQYSVAILRYFIFAFSVSGLVFLVINIAIYSLYLKYKERHLI